MTDQLIAALSDATQLGRTAGGRRSRRGDAAPGRRPVGDRAPSAGHALGQADGGAARSRHRESSATPRRPMRAASRIAGVRVNGAAATFRARARLLRAVAVPRSYRRPEAGGTVVPRRWSRGVSVGAGRSSCSRPTLPTSSKTSRSPTRRFSWTTTRSREAPASAVGADFVSRYVPLGAAAASAIRRADQAKYPARRGQEHGDAIGMGRRLA